MNIQPTRIKNLRDYIDANGGAASISRKYPEVDPSYISQILTGKRGFGEKAARKMEERLSLPINYFDTPRTEEGLSNHSIKPVEKVLRTVALLDFEQAVNYQEYLKDPAKCEFIATDANVSTNTFAIRVNDDIMMPIFTLGSAAIVEPDLSPVPNDFVFAKNGSEATLKKLVKDGGDWYLRPLNQQYPTKDASSFEIIGVITQVQSVTRFK